MSHNRIWFHKYKRWLLSWAIVKFAYCLALAGFVYSFCFDWLQNLSNAFMQAVSSNPWKPVLQLFTLLFQFLCFSVIFFAISILGYWVRRRQAYTVMQIVDFRTQHPFRFILVLSTLVFLTYCIVSSLQVSMLTLCFYAAFCFFLVSHYLQKMSHAPTNQRYLWLILCIAFFVAGMWCVLKSFHFMYVKDALYQQEWEGLFEFSFSPYDHYRSEYLKDFPVVSICNTLFAGCMLLITMSKNKPCDNWNPFTVFELNLPMKPAFLALAINCCALYATQFQMYRFAYVAFLCLLTLNIATAIFYHTVTDNYIRKTIVELASVRYEFESVLPSVGTGFERGLEWVEQTVERVSLQVLRKLPDDTVARQVQAMIEIIDDFRPHVGYIQSESHRREMGIVIGFCSLPTIHMNETPPKNEEAYYCELISAMFRNGENRYHYGKDACYDADVLFGMMMRKYHSASRNLFTYLESELASDSPSPSRPEKTLLEYLFAWNQNDREKIRVYPSYLVCLQIAWGDMGLPVPSVYAASTSIQSIFHHSCLESRAFHKL